MRSTGVLAVRKQSQETMKVAHAVKEGNASEGEAWPTPALLASASMLSGPQSYVTGRSGCDPSSQ